MKKSFLAILLGLFLIIGPVLSTNSATAEKKETYKLSISVEPSTAGSAKPIPDKKTYSKGEIVKISLKINDSYSFDHWSGDFPIGQKTDKSITVKMNSDKELIAHLAISGGAVLENIGSLNSSINPPSKGIAWTGDSMWISNAPSDNLFKTSENGKILTTFNIPGEHPGGLAWDGKHLWMIDRTSENIFQITRDGKVLSTFSSPVDVPSGLTWSNNHLWVFGIWGSVGKLSKNGKVLSSYEFDRMFADATNVDGDIWVLDYNSRDLLNFDGENFVQSFKVQGNTPLGLAHHENCFWISYEEKERIRKFSAFNYYRLDVNKSPENGGYVSLKPNQKAYREKTEIKITANPSNGFKFNRWAGDISGSDNNIILTITSDREVTAHFEKKKKSEEEEVGGLPILWIIGILGGGAGVGLALVWKFWKDSGSKNKPQKDQGPGGSTRINRLKLELELKGESGKKSITQNLTPGDNLKLGRTDFSTVLPKDDQMLISGSHLQISCRSENETLKLLVKDLDSTNGTALNGKDITSGKEHEIKSGDKLNLADGEAFVKVSIDS